MMPTICDGSSLVNGKRKPVTLVSIVVARKIAVGIRDGSDFNHPVIAIKPATMPIRLIKTCNKVKVVRLMSIAMLPQHSVYCFDELEFLSGASLCLDCGR